MKKSERLLAEKFLLQCIFEEDPDFVDRTMVEFSVSRSTVYNYINTLQKNGELERVGGSMPYRIVYRTSRVTIDTSKETDEERVYSRDIAPLLANLTPSTQKIWRYAITAMLNNAFEHANASAVVVVVSQSRLSTIVAIIDNGVGIFRRIRQLQKDRTGEMITATEAAALLYPGKYTGDPENHAGQGIFFASRMMDHFAIRSDEVLFTNDEDEFGGRSPEQYRGTAVQMALSSDSTREMGEVLARYVDPALGFVRTELPIARMIDSSFPVSRAEAKRLAAMLSDFVDVELDFAGVEDVGPDFLHELLVVQRKNRPALNFTAKNASERVAAALSRAGLQV